MGRCVMGNGVDRELLPCPATDDEMALGSRGYNLPRVALPIHDNAPHDLGGRWKESDPDAGFDGHGDFVKSLRLIFTILPSG